MGLDHTINKIINISTLGIIVIQLIILIYIINGYNLSYDYAIFYKVPLIYFVLNIFLGTILLYTQKPYKILIFIFLIISDVLLLKYKYLGLFYFSSDMTGHVYVLKNAILSGHITYDKYTHYSQWPASFTLALSILTIFGNYDIITIYLFVLPYALILVSSIVLYSLYKRLLSPDKALLLSLYVNKFNILIVFAMALYPHYDWVSLIYIYMIMPIILSMLLSKKININDILIVFILIIVSIFTTSSLNVIFFVWLFLLTILSLRNTKIIITIFLGILSVFILYGINMPAFSSTVNSIVQLILKLPFSFNFDFSRISTRPLYLFLLVISQLLLLGLSALVALIKSLFKSYYRAITLSIIIIAVISTPYFFVFISHSNPYELVDPLRIFYVLLTVLLVLILTQFNSKFKLALFTTVYIILFYIALGVQFNTNLGGYNVVLPYSYITQMGELGKFLTRWTSITYQPVAATFLALPPLKAVNLTKPYSIHITWVDDNFRVLLSKDALQRNMAYVLPETYKIEKNITEQKIENWLNKYGDKLDQVYSGGGLKVLWAP